MHGEEGKPQVLDLRRSKRQTKGNTVQAEWAAAVAVTVSKSGYMNILRKWKTACALTEIVSTAGPCSSAHKI